MESEENLIPVMSPCDDEVMEEIEERLSNYDDNMNEIGPLKVFSHNCHNDIFYFTMFQESFLKTSKFPSNLKIKVLRGIGMGVVSTKRIKKNEKISFYDGERIYEETDFSELEHFLEISSETNTFWINGTEENTGVAKYIRENKNKPNIALGLGICRDKYYPVYYALHDISINEELVYCFEGHTEAYSWKTFTKHRSLVISEKIMNYSGDSNRIIQINDESGHINLTIEMRDVEKLNWKNCISIINTRLEDVTAFVNMCSKDLKDTAFLEYLTDLSLYQKTFHSFVEYLLVNQRSCIIATTFFNFKKNFLAFSEKVLESLYCLVHINHDIMKKCFQDIMKTSSSVALELLKISSKEKKSDSVNILLIDLSKNLVQFMHSLIEVSPLIRKVSIFNTAMAEIEAEIKSVLAGNVNHCMEYTDVLGFITPIVQVTTKLISSRYSSDIPFITNITSKAKNLIIDLLKISSRVECKNTLKCAVATASSYVSFFKSLMSFRQRKDFDEKDVLSTSQFVFLSLPPLSNSIRKEIKECNLNKTDNSSFLPLIDINDCMDTNASGNPSEKSKSTLVTAIKNDKITQSSSMVELQNHILSNNLINRNENGQFLANISVANIENVDNPKNFIAKNPPHNISHHTDFEKRESSPKPKINTSNSTTILPKGEPALRMIRPKRPSELMENEISNPSVVITKISNKNDEHIPNPKKTSNIYDIKMSVNEKPINDKVSSPKLAQQLNEDQIHSNGEHHEIPSSNAENLSKLKVDAKIDSKTYNEKLSQDLDKPYVINYDNAAKYFRYSDTYDYILKNYKSCIPNFKKRQYKVVIRVDLIYLTRLQASFSSQYKTNVFIEDIFEKDIHMKVTRQCLADLSPPYSLYRRKLLYLLHRYAILLNNMYIGIGFSELSVLANKYISYLVSMEKSLLQVGDKRRFKEIFFHQDDDTQKRNKDIIRKLALNDDDIHLRKEIVQSKPKFNFTAIKKDSYEKITQSSSMVEPQNHIFSNNLINRNNKGQFLANISVANIENVNKPKNFIAKIPPHNISHQIDFEKRESSPKLKINTSNSTTILPKCEPTLRMIRLKRPSELMENEISNPSVVITKISIKNDEHIPNPEKTSNIYDIKMSVNEKPLNDKVSSRKLAQQLNEDQIHSNGEHHEIPSFNAENLSKLKVDELKDSKIDSKSYNKKLSQVLDKPYVINYDNAAKYFRYSDTYDYVLKNYKSCIPNLKKRQYKVAIRVDLIYLTRLQASFSSQYKTNVFIEDIFEKDINMKVTRQCLADLSPPYSMYRRKLLYLLHRYAKLLNNMYISIGFSELSVLANKYISYLVSMEKSLLQVGDNRRFKEIFFHQKDDTQKRNKDIVRKLALNDDDIHFRKEMVQSKPKFNYDIHLRKEMVQSKPKFNYDIHLRKEIVQSKPKLNLKKHGKFSHICTKANGIN